MLKSIKVKLLSFLCLFVVFALCIVGATVSQTKKVSAENDADNLFQMVDTVSVRLDGDGLRFKAQMGVNVYNSIDDVNNTLYFIIMPEEYLDYYGTDYTNAIVRDSDGNYDVDNSHCLYVKVNKAKHIFLDDGVYYVNAGVQNVKEENRDMAFVGIACIEKKNGNVFDYVCASPAGENGMPSTSQYNALISAMYDDTDYTGDILNVPSYSWFGTADYPLLVETEDDYKQLVSKINANITAFDNMNVNILDSVDTTVAELQGGKTLPANTKTVYTVTFKNVAGDVVKEIKVYSGTEIVPPENTQATAQYTYSWKDIPEVITQSAEYIEVSTLNKYTVLWKVDDAIIETDSNVEYGSTPSFDGDTPTKSATAEKRFAFKDWDKEVAPITGNTTYNAVFNETDLIDSVADFKDIANNLSGDYELTADIDFTSAEFTTIGNWDDIHEFAGNFDGNGHKIINVTISDSVKSSNFAALFAANKGTVKNVYVEMATSGDIIGQSSIGVVGINLEGGKIENVYAYIKVNGAVVETSGTADTYSVYGGTVAGRNNGVISNCIGSVNVDSNATCVFGLISGMNTGTINNSYGISNVSSYNIAKRTDGSHSENNCAKYDDISDIVDADIIKAENGFNMNIWNVEEDKLSFGNTVIENIYKVFTVIKQKDVSNFCSIISNHLGGYFVLGEDLDFTGVTLTKVGAWDGSNEFKGTFDGNGYTINNLNLNNNACALIYANEGTIKNLRVNMYTTESVPANLHYGLVAVNCAGGVIENVYSRLYLNHNTDSDAYGMRLGVVVGSNKGGTVNNCVGEVVAKTGLTTTTVGLIVGWNDSGSISNCYGVKYGQTFNIVKSANQGTETNCAIYATPNDLASANVITEANGFDMNIWAVDNGNVKYSGNVIDLAGATVLTQNKVNDFFTTLNGNKKGYFVLGEDLDFTGVTVQSIGNWTWGDEFLGVLDGQGYKMTNIALTASNSSVFAANAGVIKNLYVEMTINEATDGRVGFVALNLPIDADSPNGAVLSNLYCKLNVNAALTGNQVGAVCGRNFNRIVENCIGEIVMGNGIEVNNVSTLYAYSDGNATATNCYGITNNTSVGTAMSGGVTNYDSVSALVSAVGTDITSANGFASYWKVENSQLYFNNNLIG